MPRRRDPLPSLGALARRLARVVRAVRRHGPLGVSVPATDPHTEGWIGPVVRLENLTDAQRIALGGRARDDAAYTSEHHTWFCASCRHWTMRGSYLTGRCCWCGTPRGAPE